MVQSQWQISLVNTHSETTIFCFSARNDETYSFRFCNKRREETKQTENSEQLTIEYMYRINAFG